LNTTTTTTVVFSLCTTVSNEVMYRIEHKQSAASRN